jgi:hypothetical protein
VLTIQWLEGIMFARCQGKSEHEVGSAQLGSVSALEIVAWGVIARWLRWSDSMLIGWSLLSLLGVRFLVCISFVVAPRMITGWRVMI